MTVPDPIRQPATLALLDRMASDCADISNRSAAMTNELARLRRLLSEPVPDVARPATPTGPILTSPGQPVFPQQMPFPGQPVPPMQTGPIAPMYQPMSPFGPPPGPPVSRPMPPARPPRVRRSSSQIIGRILAAAGVGVTLIGVVLLLVLAAQAGLLRPELRVAGGAVFAAVLLGVGILVHRRPTGQVGGIALVATGIGAAYIDVMASSAIYHWLPAPAALVVAGVVAGAGLGISRWWDSQSLGVLTVIPLLVLAPIITRGLDFTLIAFMLVLSAAALWVPIGKDWLAFYGSRTAVSTIPLMLAPLMADGQVTGNQAALLIGCVVLNALLAVGSSLLVLRPTRYRLALVAISGLGALPMALAAAILDARVCAAVIAGFAVVMLLLGAFGAKLPGVTAGVRIGWFTLAALASVVALPMAFDQTVVVPALLSIATGLAAASLARPGNPDEASFILMFRIVATCVAGLGGLGLLVLCPPWYLFDAPDLTVGELIAGMISSLLAIAAVVLLAMSFHRVAGPSSASAGRALWAVAGVISVYQGTQFAVLGGLLVAGPDGGFLGGHVAATIGWVAVAAALLGYATRVRGPNRTMLVGAGLTLTAGAVGKLFLFDLATLDGLFRVVVFIVVGLVLLALGAGYARLLGNADNDNTPAPR